MEGEKVRELALDVIVAVGGDREFWSTQSETRKVDTVIERIVEQATYSANEYVYSLIFRKAWDSDVCGRLTCAGLMGEIWGWCEWRTRSEVDEVNALLDCRVGRLLRRGQFFIVVADDEPYFETVYGMIREHELAEGHWTDADEAMYVGVTSQGA